MTTPDTPRIPPGSAASDEAMLVLLVLHAHPEGLRQPRLLQLTHLTDDALSACLRGLRERGRIVPEGKGPGTVWRTYPHALAAGRAARQAAEAQA